MSALVASADMMDERSGEAYEFEERLTVLGAKLNRSEIAPDFTLDHFDGQAIHGVTLADSDGCIRILNVVNSLDTPICDIETRRWEQLRSELPRDVVVLTISMDLPFAQARWGQGADLGHQALSSHRSEEFGRSYGVLIKEWRMLQRAVFVVDADRRLVHAEYVDDQMQEPDYQAAVDAVRSVTT
ncbi:MAG: thiol peroxidase [Pseudonocardiaceae bacterium]